ncbi:MAG: CDP-diacylglycerol--glycerol-3-phosphate 3-phosphatidyltransferase [Deltaproteobacteria bacterium]|nr:CDP-diacylglycerol--glycerol-3-phosphate 3-phosphatidyltransferase [Deltaproteobacteria bacterium]
MQLPKPTLPSRIKKKKKPRKAPGPLQGEIFNLPNILTMGRVAIIPAVMWQMELSDPGVAGEWAARKAVFVATSLFALASITDFLDGWLARNLNMQSAFGRFLDPLADKLLVLACLVELVQLGRAPVWLVVLLLSREVAITGLRAIAAEEGFDVPSDRWGKWKTALQMVGLIGLLLHFPTNVDFVALQGSVDFHRVGLTLLAASMIFSIGSAGGYLGNFVRQAFVRRAAS